MNCTDNCHHSQPYESHCTLCVAIDCRCCTWPSLISLMIRTDCNDQYASEMLVSSWYPRLLSRKKWGVKKVSEKERRIWHNHNCTSSFNEMYTFVYKVQTSFYIRNSKYRIRVFMVQNFYFWSILLGSLYNQTYESYVEEMEGAMGSQVKSGQVKRSEVLFNQLIPGVVLLILHFLAV